MNININTLTASDLIKLMKDERDTLHRSFTSKFDQLIYIVRILINKNIIIHKP